jgi:hypothetical protein
MDPQAHQSLMRWLGNEAAALGAPTFARIGHSVAQTAQATRQHVSAALERGIKATARQFIPPPEPPGPYTAPNGLNFVAEGHRELARTLAQNRWTGGLASRPYFHLQDRIIGGIPGAVAGYMVDDRARKHDRSWKDRVRRVAAIAAGGWAGGKALNATMNVGRKYVANTSPLYGYEQALSVAPTPQAIWRHGILDEPHVIPLKPNDDRIALAPRRELLRRYLGVHRDNPASDAFVRNADGSLGFNPATLNKEELGPALWAGETNARTVLDTIPAASLAYDRADFDAHNPYSEILGSHHMEPVPGRPRTFDLSDAWNFAPDPGDAPGRDILSRVLAERLLRQQTPVIRQRVALPENGATEYLPHPGAGRWWSDALYGRSR